ncbi:MAG: alanine racemase [Alphaproteobacteria bacterium]|nr:alanine racemase [Alphaproteobacteria bacterium]
MSLFNKITTTVLTQPVLEINLNKLIDNYKLLSQIAMPATPSAVIKDDAYGVGACEVAKVLYEKAGCRHFWFAHACEAQKVVDIVPEAKIYVLQGIGKDSVELFQRYKFIPVITSLKMWQFYKKHQIDGVKPVIYIETGLNRLGFREDEIKKLSRKDLKSFSLVMSHLACADEKDHFMNTRQLEKFKYLREKYFKDMPATLSASDGAFLGADYCLDMVRLGAAMYGINTTPYRLNQMKNLITLKAPVLQICPLQKGEFVGYSATYRANTERKIAIVSIGYGDGVPRSLSNVGKVFFKVSGRWAEARILGRVSMDNIICDVTDIKGLEVGNYGYLIMDDYTLDDIARDSGTIGYEIASNIGKNPRCIKKYISGTK